ncbi:hypothetical protein BRADI_1g20313v3 [Brachypodium distachyon]|uniref:Uncharacterized protein n=1 Tax=Brachypodium distachyon TaxID=15368 RepID=A0A0Q3RPX2_BRADI|nr:hypothetical protein BRADI_1g20313v3 [Brachypodium distachyon]PNT74676.1 hypothetical protein BRADI_1g20313v3 [Brachypodium distachyon]PNT74678.1 hypothetical protein BRADI_1g20313v3 [Brachypodium distachyon]PNT74686.1 hypothetical protein BRADI_1g20313v3 [Brachypodium distachyon]
MDPDPDFSINAAAAKFADQAARAKIALNGQFVLAMASYPFVVGFTFAARSGLLNVVKPAGVPSTGFDLWKTSDAASLVKTALSFTAVLAVHVVLLGHLLMMRLPGAPYLSRQCLVAGPMLLFFITINYFYTYLTHTRYGASTKEWYIFTVFTVLLVVITGWMYLVPIKQETVAKNGKEPEPAAQV